MASDVSWGLKLLELTELEELDIVEELDVVEELEELEELEQCMALQEYYLKKQDSAKEMGELDGEFHRIIFAASKSRPLQNVLTSFHNYIRRARAVSVCVTGRAEESVSEHRAILEAITKHDGELAEKLTAEHIKNARDNIATTVHTSCES